MMPESWLGEGLSRWARMMALPSEHLPFILPREGKFWADEFQWKPVPGFHGWLTAKPLDADEKYQERFDLILDPRTSLPRAVQKHEPGLGNTRVVRVVEKMRINAHALTEIAPMIDESSSAWKMIRQSLPRAAKAE